MDANACGFYSRLASKKCKVNEIAQLWALENILEAQKLLTW